MGKTPAHSIDPFLPPAIDNFPARILRLHVHSAASAIFTRLDLIVFSV